ncbi:hypothetical protein NECID01_0215 [Nematocida sp. AWRm77]|nr:hypothetical protein NECID01_0215 [Nematocida sp. AWRm77]
MQMSRTREEKEVESEESRSSFSNEDARAEESQIEKAFSTLRLDTTEQELATSLELIFRRITWEILSTEIKLGAIQIGLGQQTSRKARILQRLMTSYIAKYLSTPKENTPKWEEQYQQIATLIIDINKGRLIDLTEQLEKHGSLQKWTREAIKLHSQHEVTWEKAILILLSFEKLNSQFQDILDPGCENWQGLKALAQLLERHGQKQVRK